MWSLKTDRQTHINVQTYTQIGWPSLSRWAPGLVWKGVTSEKHVIPAWWAICLIKRPLFQSIWLSARELCTACPQFPPLCFCVCTQQRICWCVHCAWQMQSFVLRLCTNKAGCNFFPSVWYKKKKKKIFFIVIIHEYNEISPAACKCMRQLWRVAKSGERG